MQKFKQFVKKLSLTQQLFVLVIIFITFIGTFFFVFISQNIEEVIQNQMFSILDQTQEKVVDNLKGDTQASYHPDPIMTHVIYNYRLDLIELTSNPTEFEPSALFNSPLGKQLAQHLTEYTTEMKMGALHGVFYGEKNVYYSIMRLDGQRLVISFVNSDYMQEFKSSFVSSIIYVTVIVVGALLAILMIWVVSLIRPLNQIKNYIEKIKTSEEATLNINREDEIGDLAGALVDMRTELQRQEKTKEDMIHNISHDLKTPIATIKSYAESIKDGVYPYDTLEKSVDVIIENASRLEKKVHSLLYMNRVEYLISQDIDVKANMKEIIENILLNVKVLRLDIQITTSLEDVFFDGNEEAWRVAVENIIENALRYAVAHINISLSEKDGLSISNDGKKMSKERIQSLFKPYEKGQDGNFGLGLSIVAKVAKANQYQIKGENIKNGVCFRIYKLNHQKKKR